MKKKIILAFLLFPFAASGQKDSITDYKPEKYETKFGPSKRHYAYAYFNFLFATPPDENNDAEIFYGKTHSISYGVRYRLKITNFFAVGTGINYTYSVWHFKQTENKKIPTSEIYDKEKIKIHTLEEDIFLRFKTKKKKNSAENFLDAGIYGNWDFSDKRQYKIYTDDDSDDGYKTFIGINSNLNYLNKLNYGCEARIGHGKVVLFVKYRLSNLFTDEYKKTISETELPRLSTGLEIGF